MGNRLTEEEVNNIHNWIKERLVAICWEFSDKYLGPNSPYYPQAAYIQLAAVTELMEEIKRNLRAPIGQKWTIIYTMPDGQQGMGLCDDYKALPKMIESLTSLKYRNILIRDDTIYKDYLL